MEIKESTIFETNNLDLGTFLLMEDVKLLELKKSNVGKVVVMRFLDDHGKCLDLEQVFLRSDIKKYRELQKWLLKKIHGVINGD